MSLIKFGSNNGNGNTLEGARVMAPAPVAATPPPLPRPAAATVTAPPVSAAGVNPEVAALLEKLRAAEAAVASEKARADAAEKAKAAGRGYSMKASEKGAISIYGVSTKFPVTLYAPHFVGIVRDLIMTGKASAFLREHAERLSVKVDGTGQAGTSASSGEIRRLADELDRVTGKA